MASDHHNTRLSPNNALVGAVAAALTYQLEPMFFQDPDEVAKLHVSSAPNVGRRGLAVDILVDGRDAAQQVGAERRLLVVKRRLEIGFRLAGHCALRTWSGDAEQPTDGLSVAQNVQREYTLQRSVGKGHSLSPLWNQARVEGLFAGEPRPRFLFWGCGLPRSWCYALG